eukprot:g3640.t1
MKEIEAIAFACLQAIDQLAQKMVHPFTDDDELERTESYKEKVNTIVPLEDLILDDEEFLGINSTSRNNEKYVIEEFQELVDEIFRVLENTNFHQDGTLTIRSLRRPFNELKLTLENTASRQQQRRVCKFIREHILPRVKALQPLPKDEQKKIEAELSQISKMRVAAFSDMSQFAKCGQYDKARKFEKRVIAFDVSAVQLNRALRENIGTWQAVKANSNDEYDEYIKSWENSFSKVSKLDSAARFDDSKIVEHLSKLSDYHSRVEWEHEQQISACEERLRLSEMRRQKNYESLFELLEKERKRASEHICIQMELDEMKKQFKSHVSAIKHHQYSSRMMREQRREVIDRHEVERKCFSQAIDIRQCINDAVKIKFKKTTAGLDSKLAKLLFQHYRLVRQAIGVLTSKMERLKRRSEVLTAKLEDCKFEIKHAYETELRDDEVRKLRDTIKECKEQIQEAIEERQAYNARVVEISGSDFKQSIKLLESSNYNFNEGDRNWIEKWKKDNFSVS